MKIGKFVDVNQKNLEITFKMMGKYLEKSWKSHGTLSAQKSGNPASVNDVQIIDCPWKGGKLKCLWIDIQGYILLCLNMAYFHCRTRIQTRTQIPTLCRIFPLVEFAILLRFNFQNYFFAEIVM